MSNTLIMSSFSVRHYPSISSLAYFVLIFPYVITVPIPANKTFYQKSVDYLEANHCEMPNEVTLPFNQTLDNTPFSYLSIPLKECQIDESLKVNEEAYLLCKEIFDVLKNITCLPYNVTLPEIKSTKWSGDVCIEAKSLERFLPKQNDYLSGNLINRRLCEILCGAKFEPLCKTVLWSYDVQIQIKNAIGSYESENVKALNQDDAPSPMPAGEVINANDADTTRDAAEPEINPKDVQQEPLLGNSNNQEEEQTAEMPNDKPKNPVIKNAETLSPATKDPSGMKPFTKLSTLDDNQSVENLNQIPRTINLSQDISSKTAKNATDKNSQPEKPNTAIQNNELDPNKKISDNNAIPGGNEVTEETQQKESKPIDLPQVINGQPNLILDENGNQNKKVSASSTLEARKNKMTTISTNNVQTTTKIENSIPVNVPEENELNNVNLQGEENESALNGRPSDTQQSDNDKVAEKPKETDSDPNKPISDAESTTLQISAGNNADEEQDEKEAEQYYNDTENNEADYPKSEYEINEVTKPKKMETKTSVVNGGASLNDFPSNYDGFMNTRNNIGRVPDEIQMVSSFPEQEDSHFFFYFLSIVLILMAGYLIFHNKQKIIALIVEGRHERRRRSHGAGYKKLETK